MVSGTRSSWRPVTGSVPQGTIVGPIVLKIFLIDLDDRAESTPGSFQTIQSWEKQLIHQMVVCCLSGAPTGGRMGQRGPHEVQQREMQSPAPGKE